MAPPPRQKDDLAWPEPRGALIDSTETRAHTFPNTQPLQRAPFPPSFVPQTRPCCDSCPKTPPKPTPRIFHPGVPEQSMWQCRIRSLTIHSMVGPGHSFPPGFLFLLPSRLPLLLRPLCRVFIPAQPPSRTLPPWRPSTMHVVGTHDPDPRASRGVGGPSGVSDRASISGACVCVRALNGLFPNFTFVFPRVLPAVSRSACCGPCASGLCQWCLFGTVAHGLQMSSRKPNGFRNR